MYPDGRYARYVPLKGKFRVIFECRKKISMVLVVVDAISSIFLLIRDGKWRKDQKLCFCVNFWNF